MRMPNPSPYTSGAEWAQEPESGAAEQSERRPGVVRQSCRCLGRLISRTNDPRPARALKPDIAVVSTAIQVAAPLVLSDEGHQGSEHIRHGAGRLSRPGKW
jgi:hypothetical protein